MGYSIRKTIFGHTKAIDVNVVVVVVDVLMKNSETPAQSSNRTGLVRRVLLFLAVGVDLYQGYGTVLLLLLLLLLWLCWGSEQFQGILC